MQAKNRTIEDQNDLKEEIAYKERIIDALKGKLYAINKAGRPRRKNLFGSGDGSDMQSEYSANAT